ncbi:MAG TPA: MurT ligase domain-containing protein, partial [Patescibacteria group bacterium]|nr:MurT ligase domain-containing protein [Patescibacteria group bacterium]
TTSFTTSLSGLYNQYNITAAVLLAKSFGLTEEQIIQGLKTFTPAFGRQEVLTINDKKVEVVLTKNPAGFNQALSTIIKQNCSHLLLVLNDRIADGTDVSWIWDVDFEKLHLLKRLSITVTGDRVYDLALRLKYADLLTRSEENVENAIKQALLQTDNGDILYILPTYTAMLEVRKILTGKKIL